MSATSRGRRWICESKVKARAIIGIALAMTTIFFAASAVVESAPQTDPAGVKIEVHADRSQGAWHSIWNFWGYDEPNYTYAANGKKLLRDSAA